MAKKKIIVASLFLIVFAILTAAFICNKIIVDTAKNKLYADALTIPYNKVGLLLGTSKYGSRGYNNPYYDFRIEAAVKLLKSGKIKYIVISGDNSSVDYNEPEAMRSDLISAGIDSGVIYLDYAGFRTFDSIIRLKEIFGQNSVTVISQRFHNERAIYIASKLEIAAIGFNATNVGSKAGLKTQLREKLARVKVFLDFLIGTNPKFLGAKISIPA